ncbi:Cna B-type domain-containing protein [Clostridium paraputrificum]|uniref:Cna B-type domain-containing protein n=1 Tax=Clostridium paraputrificum TaxID=29363 RepID=UPI003D32494D
MWKLKAKQIICIVFIILSLSSGYVTNAKESLDIGKKASLEIYHSYMDRPLKNVEFNIYKVASIKSSSEFEITEAFKNYQIDFSSLKDESDWYLLFDTLATYVKVDGIRSDRKLETNTEGKVKFSNLDVGIYLVLGETSSFNNNKYEMKPFLVSVPIIDEITDDYNYDVKVTTKCEEIQNDKTSFIVQKKWSNDKFEERPTSININLYRNNSVYKTVTLSEDNNWKYQWNDLDNNVDWTVKEENVPLDYTVTYEKYNNTVIIVNTYKKDPNIPSEINTSKTGDQRQMIPLINVLLISMAICIIILAKRKKA